jgi:hypothetical protein
VVTPAELPLVTSAFALALVAMILAIPRQRLALRAPTALIVGTIGSLVPLVALPLRDPARAAGRALWEWSAVGGPTIQASYRFDGLAAVGVAAVVAYTTAGLLGIDRASRKHELLPGVVLATGFVSIALAVTDDLVAATVVLGVVAALTAFAELVVAPASASARLVVFFTVGLQSFVVAALLISRSGVATFSFGAIQATSISPGVVLAASFGAALFAGLYPFVPWRYEGEGSPAPEREPLRGLLAMPAGLGATLVLARLLGATRIDLPSLSLPEVHATIRFAAAAGVLALLVIAAVRQRRPPRPRLAGATVLLAGILAYPLLHWSHVVLAAALLTVAYAAAVSLALPERWEVVRYDVALAALWIGLAVGTPLAIAGGLFLVVADAAATLAASIWLPPHRWYIATVATSAAFVAGALAIGVGIQAAAEPASAVLAVVALAPLLLLALVHIGSGLSGIVVPAALEAAAAASALLGSLLLFLLAGPAIAAAVADTLARPFDSVGVAATAFLSAAALVAATLLVVVARTVRPLLPDLSSLAGRLRGIVAAADPVPATLASFRIVEAVSTRSSAAFASFERAAGVWVAALLIFGLLVWATRT